MEDLEKKKPDPPDLLATRIEQNGDVEEMKRWWRRGKLAAALVTMAGGLTWRAVCGGAIIIGALAATLTAINQLLRLLEMLR